MGWRHRRRRRAARVVLLDPDGRVLLFRLDAGRDPDGRGYWYLPGGGIRMRESIEAAARRELREETGLREVTIGPVVGTRTGVRFWFAGREIVQDEWYVAGRVATSSIGQGRLAGGERDAVEAARWWSLAELATTDEVVYPPGLPDLIELAAGDDAGDA